MSFNLGRHGVPQTWCINMKCPIKMKPSKRYSMVVEGSGCRVENAPTASQ